MNKLRVLYKGWGECRTLGTLAAGDVSLMFEYSPEALARKLELSPFRMPLREQAFSRGNRSLAACRALSPTHFLTAGVCC